MELATRATRFPLHLPLLYREPGQSEWRRGRTENLSHTGVLFEAEEALPAQTQLEIGLLLLVDANDPQVMCQGFVVRSLPESLEMAARISGYQFVGRTCREGSGDALGSPRTSKGRKR